MDLGLANIAQLAAADPSLIVILVLVFGVTAVSGATDAPNAVAVAVSTRSIKPNTALVLAAIFDCIGLVLFSFVSTAVAHTMFAMVDFSGSTSAALHALTAAMVGVILWGVFCWWRGIPISKSHALIAGITGGAIAMNGWAGVVSAEWAKVLIGMAFSLVAGFALGWGAVKGVRALFLNVARRKTSRIFLVVQDILACMTGMPVSTSHCSTAAIMGVGAEKSVRRVNWDLAKSMVFA